VFFDELATVIWASVIHCVNRFDLRAYRLNYMEDMLGHFIARDSNGDAHE
jgi:hypothetical protein